MKTYLMTIKFDTNRELTQEELGQLQHQAVAQIEDPVDENGEAVDYATDFYGCDIDEVKGSIGKYAYCDTCDNDFIITAEIYNNRKDNLGFTEYFHNCPKEAK